MSLWEAGPAALCTRVLTHSDTILPIHTYTHSSLASPWGGPTYSICLGLVGYGGCEYVNNRVQTPLRGGGGDRRQSLLPRLPGKIFLYLTVTEGEPRSGKSGDTLGHRILVA